MSNKKDQQQPDDLEEEILKTLDLTNSRNVRAVEATTSHLLD
jgi:hypothetical protein